MTAESQPRHPLALLADYAEARAAYEAAVMERRRLHTLWQNDLHNLSLKAEWLAACPAPRHLYAPMKAALNRLNAAITSDPVALRAEQARINALESENAALRAQAEAEAGLVLVPRDALSRVAADPYYYRDRIDGSDLDESLCFGCNAEEGDTHNPDCPMVTLAAALAQAGGES